MLLSVKFAQLASCGKLSSQALSAKSRLNVFHFAVLLSNCWGNSRLSQANPITSFNNEKGEEDQEEENRIGL